MKKISQEIFLKWMISVLIGIITTGCSAEIKPRKEALEVIKNIKTDGSERSKFMKFSRKPPASWFWSHDIDPAHIHDVMMPGMHLVRLSVYGNDKRRRFASISYAEESEIKSIYLQDIAVTDLDDNIARTGARPISITGSKIKDQLRFSLALHKDPGPKTTVHTDLNEAGLNQLISPQHRISDFTVYIVDGTPKYAAIVEERPGPSIVLARVSAAELEVHLRDNNLTPIRVRGFSEGGIRYFTAVAERIDVADWHWYDNLDSDTLAQKLDANNAYPFDLDTYRTEDDVHAVRFTVIMYSNHN
ncbi:hypothetical protein [Nitrosomonas ureae]|uniref:Uncharacterized protein n=1 Tax=Nitrosomonas ureae TaxID=44577 RepID=A0A1H9BIM4_9PROT|nr:hypothetical protein [Nitrosomonas ureae]PXX17627.1 hypothetical protein C8R27_10338 [Nitrosomonas ureae]SEP88755.1 hypothetical protein SAMN05421510_100836 [Nitrosomonas ureae]